MSKNQAGPAQDPIWPYKPEPNRSGPGPPAPPSPPPTPHPMMQMKMKMMKMMMMMMIMSMMMITNSGTFYVEWLADWANHELWCLDSVEWWANWTKSWTLGPSSSCHGAFFWHGVVRFMARVFLTIDWFVFDVCVLGSIQEGMGGSQEPLTNWRPWYKCVFHILCLPIGITIAYWIAIGLLGLIEIACTHTHIKLPDPWVVRRFMTWPTEWSCDAW